MIDNTPQVNTNLTESITTTHVEKHITLYEALDELRAVKQQANQLLEKITGDKKVQTPPSRDEVKQPPPVQPTLQGVLNESPGKIYKICSEVHEILENIKQAIF